VPDTLAAVPVVFWLPAVFTPGRSMFAEPLKLTPPIVLEVCSVVAVLAFPVRAPVKPVEVTDVKPATVVAEEPSVIAVEPIVTVLLVNPALFTVPVALTFGVNSDKFLLMVI
jgi:hypothetical protein